VAPAAAAGDEDHAGGRDARHEERVVVGAGYLRARIGAGGWLGGAVVAVVGKGPGAAGRARSMVEVKVVGRGDAHVQAGLVWTCCRVEDAWIRQAAGWRQRSSSNVPASRDGPGQPRRPPWRVC
jgi:hypothetical protein